MGETSGPRGLSRRAVLTGAGALALAGCTGAPTPPSSGASTPTSPTRYAGLVGVEIDRAYPVPGTPVNLQVIAHSPVPQFQKPDTHSDMTSYSTAGGAGVFSVGSLAWTAGLRGARSRKRIDDRAATFARTVTGNLLRAMSDGPRGRVHPAAGNLPSIGASPSTCTGTGGRVAPA